MAARAFPTPLCIVVLNHEALQENLWVEIQHNRFNQGSWGGDRGVEHPAHVLR